MSQLTPKQIKFLKYEVSQLTPKQINDLKREHNAAQEKGRLIYAEMVALHKQCLDLQDQIEAAEGDEYDAIPLLFGGGF